MPTLVRAVTVVTVTLTGAMAMLGLATSTAAVLIAPAVIALLVGPVAAVTVYNSRPVRALALRIGAAVSAATLVVGVVLAGLVALLGTIALPIVVPLLVAGAIWVRGRRASWLDLADHASTAPQAAWPIGRPAAAGTTASAPSLSGRPTAQLVPLDLPALDIATVSTPGLCVALRRTYWLLRDLSLGGPQRLVVVGIRGELLEELERRDPTGFGRWLQTEPRAGSDPGRYLTDDH